MGKIIDLTGQRFGKLMVIELAKKPEGNKNSSSFWLCRCDCGKEKVIDGHSLRRGSSKSCGCGFEVDLVNKKFGKLFVIEETLNLNTKSNSKHWLCKCDCGNETVVATFNLTSGKTKSCGCLRTEFKIRKDLTGRIIGKLSVICFDHFEKGKGSFWLCECECGKRIIARASYLNHGGNVSCGCHRKEIIYQLILNNTKENGESSFNLLYGRYKDKAKERNLEFALNKHDFKKLTEMSCYYCGTDPHYVIKSRSGNGDYIYTGIDRLDSSKGYIDGNVVPCCGRCNVAKNNFTVEEFYEWASKLSANLLNTNRISPFNL
jgi:hypothetical protein